MTETLNRPPFATLDISFSNRCPLQCGHCMFAADMKYKGPIISPDTAKRLIDEAARLNTFTMIATGSQEFYLDYEAFLDVVDYAHEKYDAPLTITTSCYWAHTEEKAGTVFAVPAFVMVRLCFDESLAGMQRRARAAAVC